MYYSEQEAIMAGNGREPIHHYRLADGREYRTSERPLLGPDDQIVEVWWTL